MKKIKMIAVLFSVLVLLSGCAKQAPKTETYIIPTSYWTYTSTTPEEAVETFYDLGEEYYTDVKIVDEGVQAELTDAQRDRLIQRNNDYIKKLVTEYETYNSEYRYVPDENYQKVDFYFDEKIPNLLHAATVYNVAAGYGLNYILQNNTTDWHVDISIYNCHTDQLVVSINAPYETVSYGPAEWAASYNE